MRFLFLTLMVAACGGPPLSSTKCLRASSLSGGGELGCLYKPSPLQRLPALLLPKATAMFSQPQDNGQHCLYEGSTSLSQLGREDVSISIVRGISKAATKFSLAAEDVYIALQVKHMTDKLRLRPRYPTGWKSVFVGGYILAERIRQAGEGSLSRCLDAKFLYREAGDIFLRGDFTQQIDRLRDLCGDKDATKIVELAAQNTDEKLTGMLQMAEKVFSGNRAVIYYDAALVNAFHPGYAAALVRSFREESLW